MSPIKGGRNADYARKWYDWALTAEAQALAARAKSYQVASNRSAPAPARAPGSRTSRRGKGPRRDHGPAG